jgi:hypothetical protein
VARGALDSQRAREVGSELLPWCYRWRPHLCVHRPLVARFFSTHSRRAHCSFGHNLGLWLSSRLKVHLQARKLERNAGKTIRERDPRHCRHSMLCHRSNRVIFQQPLGKINFRKYLHFNQPPSLSCQVLNGILIRFLFDSSI